MVLPKTNFDGCNRLQTDNITKRSCRTFYFRFHDLYATCFVVAHILLEFVWKFHSSSCQNVWKHIVLEVLWSSLKRVLPNNEETNCSDINYKTQNAWQQGDVVVKFGIAFFYNPKTTMPPWRIEKKGIAILLRWCLIRAKKSECRKNSEGKKNRELYIIICKCWCLRSHDHCPKNNGVWGGYFFA